jgi:hypothetical protein
MAKRERRENYDFEEMQEKVNRIRQMFTTTSATVAAVAVVFVLNPFSERARIEELKGFEDSIYYHVYVNEAINFSAGSLALVFETEEEVFRIPLNKGITYGVLEGVKPLTGYPARIEGSEGFGVSTIVSSGVYTKNEPDFEMYDPVLRNGEKDPLLIYDFKTKYQDLNNQINKITLTYGYTPLLTNEYIELFNQEIDINQAIELINIPNENALVSSQIIAEIKSKDDEGREIIQNIILDEDSFYTPLYHESSFEIIRVIDSVIEYEVIPDYRFLKDVSYKVSIFENNRILETKTVNSSNTLDEHLLRFERLLPNTQYKIVNEMLFFDHRTNANNSLIVAETDIKTLERFDFITSIADQETRLVITILVKDINALFGKAYYEIRDGNNVLSSQELNLSTVDRDTKYAEFAVNKLELMNKTLVFGVIMDATNTKYEIRKIRR